MIFFIICVAIIEYGCIFGMSWIAEHFYDWYGVLFVFCAVIYHKSSNFNID
jgi:hypothetical protein